LLDDKLRVCFESLANVVDVFVTATGKRDQNVDVFVLALERISQRVGRFECWNDALLLGEQLESFKCLSISNADVLRATGSVQVRVLWAYAWVIQSGGDRVGLLHLAVAIAHEVAASAVQNADGAIVDGRTMIAGVQSFSDGLSADKFHDFFINEICEHANGVGAATHAGDDLVRQAVDALKHLRLRLSGDDAVELTHDGWEWVWASRCAN